MLALLLLSGLGRLLQCNQIRFAASYPRGSQRDCKVGNLGPSLVGVPKISSARADGKEQEGGEEGRGQVGGQAHRGPDGGVEDLKTERQRV